MLVVAGAGSGKTETMSARVVWLIANGHVTPAQVLGLTFTRKAAGELLERVTLRLKQLDTARRSSEKDPQHDPYDALNQPTISTYNSYASALVQEHGLRIGREPQAKLLSEASQWAIVSDIVEKWQGNIDTDKAISTITAAIISLAGALNEHLLTVEDAKKQMDMLIAPLEDIPISGRRKTVDAEVRKLGGSLSTRYQLLDLVQEYNEYKRTHEAIDFGDQVALAAQLAETVPLVGELERDRYKVVLLDEYQDTSYAQIRFLSALFGQGHPVTAVGDPNQSIYAWRGASAAGPARFPEQFRKADGTRADIHKLGISWRNDLAILRVANVTSAPLYQADPNNSLPALEPRPQAGTGRACAGIYATIEDEAEAIAQFLKEHWKPGSANAAILCRKRSQFPLLESTLRAHGIPVEIVGLGGLLATPEVVDLIALLEAVHDPSRGDSVMRLLTGPRFNLGASDLIALGAYARYLTKTSALRRAQGKNSEEHATTHIESDVVDERSILDAVTELPANGWTSSAGEYFSAPALERLKDLNATLEHLRQLTYLPLPEFIDACEKTLGLDVEMALAAERARRAGAPFDPTNPNGRAHLDAFRRVAVNFSDTALVPTLGAFLAWLRDAITQERGLDRPVGIPDPHAVQIITVHASKGLEWDVVAVPGLVDGQFPGTASLGEKGPQDSGWLTALGALPYPLRGDARDLPTCDYSAAAHDKDVRETLDIFKTESGVYQVLEERRLAYVAFTRARTTLMLTGSWWREGKRPVQPSEFLTELVNANAVDMLCDAQPPQAGETNPRDGYTLHAAWPFELSDGLGATPTDLHENDTADTLIAQLAQLPNTLKQWEESPAQHQQRTTIAHTLALTRIARHLVDHATYPDDILTTPMLTPAGIDLADLTGILLAERQETNKTREDVAFPEHISVSGIVDVHRDRQAYAIARRRPIPREPSVASRRGTTFHLWVEKFYGMSTLFDIDDMPSADEDYIADDTALEALQKTFEHSQWASMRPIALERDIDIVVAGVAVRARIDAVFEDPDKPGSVIVVDWKTGSAPRDTDEKRSRELQLALYRIAWSELSGLPLHEVSAAFYYVANDTTVRPTNLPTKSDIENMLKAHNDSH